MLNNLLNLLFHPRRRFVQLDQRERDLQGERSTAQQLSGSLAELEAEADALRRAVGVPTSSSRPPVPLHAHTLSRQCTPHSYTLCASNFLLVMLVAWQLASTAYVGIL